MLQLTQQKAILKRFPTFFLKTLEAPLCLHGERKATRVNIIHQHSSIIRSRVWMTCALLYKIYLGPEPESVAPVVELKLLEFFVGKRDPC